MTSGEKCSPLGPWGNGHGGGLHGGRVLLPLHPDLWTLLLTFCSPYILCSSQIGPVSTWLTQQESQDGTAPSNTGVLPSACSSTSVPSSRGHTQVLRPGPWGCLDLPSTLHVQV